MIQVNDESAAMIGLLIAEQSLHSDQEQCFHDATEPAADARMAFRIRSLRSVLKRVVRFIALLYLIASNLFLLISKFRPAFRCYEEVRSW